MKQELKTRNEIGEVNKVCDKFCQDFEALYHETYEKLEPKTYNKKREIEELAEAATTKYTYYSESIPSDALISR